jgi:pilus assembly protein Flp/PilA
MLKMYWEVLRARFLNEKGQGMVEYGLILALVAVFAITAFTNVGTAVVNKLGEVVTGLG